MKNTFISTDLREVRDAVQFKMFIHTSTPLRAQIDAGQRDKRCIYQR